MMIVMQMGLTIKHGANEELGGKEARIGYDSMDAGLAMIQETK